MSTKKWMSACLLDFRIVTLRRHFWGWKDWKSLWIAEKEVPKKEKVVCKKKAVRADDGFAFVCAVCRDFGELLCCERCRDGFHPSCLGLDKCPTIDPWLCSNCSHNKVCRPFFTLASPYHFLPLPCHDILVTAQSLCQKKTAQLVKRHISEYRCRTGDLVKVLDENFIVSRSFHKYRWLYCKLGKARQVNTTCNCVSPCLTSQVRCFKCKAFGSPEEDLVKCPRRNCGKYYHKDCTKQWIRIPRPKKASSAIADVCPRHYCDTCRQFRKNAKLYRCLHCPVAYHELCSPEGTNLLEEIPGYSLCWKHGDEWKHEHKVHISTWQRFVHTIDFANVTLSCVSATW